MVDLIDHIDEQISSCIGGKGKFFGLCRQLQDDSGIYPATVAEPSKKVTPDDKWKILVYHRLLDGTITDSEEFSFGRHPLVHNSQRVRMVVFVAFSEGEAMIDDIVNGMPDKIEIENNTDYKISETGPDVTLIRDRNAVWEQELGTSYKDKYQMRFNIYAVEYSIDYIKCSECVSD